jgi:hypothetical protein
VLRNPRPFKSPIQMPGSLGLWQPKRP